MSEAENLKRYISELIQEVEKELEEATTTANVDGYQTPYAFSRKKDKERTRKNATQLGYELVDDDVDNISEAGLKGTEKIPSTKKLSQLSDNEKLTIVQSSGNIISFKIPDWAKGRYKNWQVISTGKIKKGKDISDGSVNYFLIGKGPQKASPTYKSVKDLLNGVEWDTMELRRESVNELSDDKQKVVDYLVKKGNNKNDSQKMVDKNYDFVSKRYKGASVVKKAEIISGLQEAITEARIKRPVNRWLELKNDETMHPHKKMAHGLKELKYQLAETEKFFRWYNQIKTMNELDSTTYWKRTQNHIYKIKERLINIAKTLQEIEKWK